MKVKDLLDELEFARVGVTPIVIYTALTHAIEFVTAHKGETALDIVKRNPDAWVTWPKYKWRAKYNGARQIWVDDKRKVVVLTFNELTRRDCIEFKCVDELSWMDAFATASKNPGLVISPVENTGLRYWFNADQQLCGSVKHQPGIEVLPSINLRTDMKWVVVAAV